MPPDPGVATGILLSPVSIPVGSGSGSDFGPRDPRTLPAGASTDHRGVDFPVGEGTQIRAADGGTVIFARYAGTAGNLTVIDHGNGTCTRYMHQKSLGVREGQQVEQGEVIGRSGHTGLPRIRPLLHFELRVGGASRERRADARAVEPEPLFGRPYVDAALAAAGRGRAPRASTPALTDDSLRNGSRGPEVVEVQRKLKALGYDLGTTGPNRDGVDGDFRGATQRAVQQFQRDRNLPEAQQAGRSVRGAMAPRRQPATPGRRLLTRAAGGNCARL